MGLKSLGKKIKKFFKKLGKQIKTNLKHGTKYIAPVLISAMTGGFGSGIVKSLFGNKFAGALGKLGNNAIGKLFGGRASTAALPGAAEGAEAVADSVGASSVPGVSSIVQNTLSPVLSGAGNALPGISNAASLVSSNPLIAAIDKGAGQLMGQFAAKGILGGLEKTYGGSGENAGSSPSTTATTRTIELMDKLKPQELGDNAQTIDVGTANIAETTAIPALDREQFRKELKLKFGNNEDEEDERFKTDRFNRYSGRFA